MLTQELIKSYKIKLLLDKRKSHKNQMMMTAFNKLKLSLNRIHKII